MSTSDLTNQEKLEETYKLVLENNEILHRLQNRDRITMIFRIIYWLVIIGAVGGAYYYVRPVLDSVVTGDTRARGLFQQFEDLRSQFPESKALQQLFDQVRSSTPVSSSSTTTQ